MQNNQPEITKDEAQSAIKTLLAHKCYDPAGLKNEAFKSGVDSFLSSDTKMLNCILKEKQPPEQCEKVNIQTMYKGKGSKKILNNYRGIFLTNVLSKIFKKIVYSRMYNNISNFISPFQAGSQKNGGTIHHLLLYFTISNNVLMVYGFKTACYAYGMLTNKMNCFI